MRDLAIPVKIRRDSENASKIRREIPNSLNINYGKKIKNYTNLISPETGTQYRQKRELFLGPKKSKVPDLEQVSGPTILTASANSLRCLESSSSAALRRFRAPAFGDGVEEFASLEVRRRSRKNQSKID
jgi:hypothetical protein